MDCRYSIVKQVSATANQYKGKLREQRRGEAGDATQGRGEEGGKDNESERDLINVGLLIDDGQLKNDQFYRCLTNWRSRIILRWAQCCKFDMKG